ncbi:MAG: ATP synthase F0 subunit C [Acholeplasmatales bacterium]|nr:ATP synthase F0 subunit C [Acholeplasmatales bacterium]
MEFLTVLNNVLTTISTFLAETVSYDSGLGAGIAEGLKYVGAGLAVFTGFAAALGEGNVAAHALDAMARQPEMAGKITTTMIIGQAISETTGIYGFIVAILLIFM